MPANFLLVLIYLLLPVIASNSGIASPPLETYSFHRRKMPGRRNRLSPTFIPPIPPEHSASGPWGSAPSPSESPSYHHLAGHASKHHHHKMHHRAPPTYPVWQHRQDCSGISCSEPLTQVPYGSPCGCVYPMQVVIDLAIQTYQMFLRFEEFEAEFAAGTYMKQSQVRIMGANASIRAPGTTTVTIDLLPLGEKFDSMTALLTYQRLWQKKVPLNTTLFGDYEVIDVRYPGLPPSPPSYGVGPSETGSHQYPLTANVPPGKSRKLKPTSIAIIALSSLIIVLLFFGAVLILLKRKYLRRPQNAVGNVFDPPFTKRSVIRSILSSSVTSSRSPSLVSTMGTCRSSVKRFSLAEVEKATNKFSAKRILGEGGFGRVYHGILEDGNEVAIKLITREDHSGDREFIAEVEMLSRLHHRNLVKLIGICIEGRRRCLVYELVRNGSVDSHLHGFDKSKGPLDCDARIKIALGAARALAYLHEDSNPRVIHRDFKASNVLLEDDCTPKVSDFGLAREATEGTNHISTQVMGTFGYVAPEYAMTGHLLVKSDVYSYGVVLLELLSGRKPVYISESQGPENLVTWSRPLLTTREGLEQLIDPSLRGNCDFDRMAKVAAIASMCVHTEASERPFMGEVVQALKLICNDVDEDREDSYSQREEESSAPDWEAKGDLGLDSGWWNSVTPRRTFGFASSFVSKEYSSGPIEDIQRPHSTNTLIGRGETIARHNSSGPLRTKKKRSAFYRLRGTMSDHVHLSKRLAYN